MGCKCSRSNVSELLSLDCSRRDRTNRRSRGAEERLAARPDVATKYDDARGHLFLFSIENDSGCVTTAYDNTDAFSRRDRVGPRRQRREGGCSTWLCN
jgi:hypothetical protein